MAEDQETAEYAQHRLPDITPVETVTLYPISISMLMWTIKFYVTGIVISHEPGLIGSITSFQPRIEGRGQDQRREKWHIL